jgi:hypothetical protein
MYQFITDRLFEIFAVVFILTRNVLLSYVVYKAWTAKKFAEDEHDSVVRGTLLWLLLILVILMTYWLGLIVKAAVFQLQNRGNVDDIREDEVQQLTKNPATKKSV